MLKTIKEWLGFGGQDQHIGHGHEHGHSHASAAGHGHTHGVIDPSLSSSERGVWAIKWSFIILAITSVLQLGVVLTSGSVALLADTIHNIGDATTAIPLWVAFVLVRRKPTARYWNERCSTRRVKTWSRVEAVWISRSANAGSRCRAANVNA